MTALGASSAYSYLLSDVHLMPKAAATAAAFKRFMTEAAPRAEAVYIVGDLLEVFIGRDGFGAFESDVDATLQALSQRTPVYWMVGNRDFLWTDAASSGMIWLDDPTVVERYDQTILLTHGDALCIHDRPYQRLRAVVRNRWIQRLFRHLPLATRLSLAERARQGSQAHTQSQRVEYMDIDDAIATQWLQHAGCTTLVHGHTHRAGIRHLDTPQGSLRVVTLGDWHPEGTIARWDHNGIRLVRTDALSA